MDYVITGTGSDGEVELSLVLPTYLERDNMAPVLAQISTVLQNVPGLTYEIIVVDDNSSDGTYEAALEAAKRLGNIRAIRRTEERGLATAVIRGWQAAHGRVLGVMDADLQHPPTVLASLIAAVRNGSEVAIGSRHVEGGGVSDWSYLRRIISRGAQLIGLVLLPEVLSATSDPMSGYFLIRRSTLAGHTLNPTGYKILIECLARSRPRRISEVGYVFQERREGSSKISSRIYTDYILHLLRLRVDLLRESRFVRFCLVGLSGVVVDMGLLYLLSDPRTLGWGLTRSKLCAAQAAIITNFLLNDAWTFADLVTSNKSKTQKLHRFVKFQIICTIGLVINATILNILFNYAHMNRYLANMIAITVTTLWNYQINRLLGWRVTEPASTR
jgi:dolichol-phosphate mannosyltransferase